jgi:hypothetical protein
MQHGCLVRQVATASASITLPAMGQAARTLTAADYMRRAAAIPFAAIDLMAALAAAERTRPALPG